VEPSTLGRGGAMKQVPPSGGVVHTYRSGGWVGDFAEEVGKWVVEAERIVLTLLSWRT